MSHHEFHVHGPHDHALEHATHGPPDGFAGRLAVTTAILATLGAIFSYVGGEKQAASEALAHDAAIHRTRAVSLWAAYQTASAAQALNELAIDLVPDARRAFHEGELKRHRAEREDVRAEADRLEREAVALDERSNAELKTQHKWARSTTVLQISIAMAAIALLTKRRWLQYGVYGLGSIGAAMGLLAFFQA
jgi:hypothetical protein